MLLSQSYTSRTPTLFSPSELVIMKTLLNSFANQFFSPVFVSTHWQRQKVLNASIQWYCWSAATMFLCLLLDFQTVYIFGRVILFFLSKWHFQRFIFRFPSSRAIHLDFRILPTVQTGSGADWSVNLTADMIFGKKIHQRGNIHFLCYLITVLLSHHQAVQFRMKI